ncbi:2-aminoethylphosphonate--pyruvate transaminase [Paenibacillus mendelii]|uniref:2-aminoethylphosphonate--pyruvate transaminase n=1 Tax=Paenibacillus mendelii TaxID=206163 RepID=A0ABV6J790_9BACL|nr:2-aminoethylphosphonate--pyruvate transaminase [Paenibacillus mendelii]MCQ6561780.1 2-aminoethylphosphonate--pyruvate transaminase [Paenibacillus mendelii]
MDDNPYLLLTPGPLSTSKRVKAAMLKDWCTWDREYNDLVQNIRSRLVALATKRTGEYSCVLMQGSGTFCVESVIGSALGRIDKLLVLTNGAYGKRIAQMAQVLGISTVVQDSGEVSLPDLDKLEETLRSDETITHVAMVHCETTTGVLNPIQEAGRIVKSHGKVFIVDAMSSFGGVPLDAAEIGIDFLISSANKCIQGVPGFGFVIARIDRLQSCQGQARSLSLDLFDQWDHMEKNGGKWRYTSPTHIVHAFYEALTELEEEGGVSARYERYRQNQLTLVSGMREIHFETLLPDEAQSPIITSFYYPKDESFTFETFYKQLKEHGFVIYPGKISNADTFRIGNIGEIDEADMKRLVAAVEQVRGDGQSA